VAISRIQRGPAAEILTRNIKIGGQIRIPPTINATVEDKTSSLQQVELFSIPIMRDRLV
jgi:hypothetical protein